MSNTHKFETINLPKGIAGTGHGTGTVTQHFDVPSLGTVGDILVNTGAILSPTSNYCKRDYIYIASELLTAGTLVYLSGQSYVRLASYDKDTSRDRIIGINLYNTPAMGLATVRVFGEITNSGWSFPSGGGVLFVGLNGVVTLIPPASGYIQMIGIVVDSTTLFLNILNSIKLRS